MMDQVTFNNLGYLHLLWVVLAVVGVCVYGITQRGRSLRRFASAALVGHLAAGVSTGRRYAKVVLVVVAMVLVVLGLVDPRWGVYYKEVPRRGIDVMFVLDVSRSMLAEDVTPSRLERARQDIGDVLEVLSGDRVGLVTFAGNAVMSCPLTINYSAVRMTLEETTARGATRGGSLIGDAIRLAADSFVDDIKNHKVIIVITDGEDQDSYPAEAAANAFKDKGIRVSTLGLGDPADGARIPVEQNGRRTYLQYEGEQVWSKMNPGLLAKIAEAGGGVYVPAGTRRIDLAAIYQQKIATVDVREFEVSRVEQYRVRYQWFAAAAFVLLLAEALMSEKRRTIQDPVLSSAMRQEGTRV